MDQIPLAALIAARLAAKREEDQAIANRREIDAQIAARLAREDKPEGTVTEKTDGYKVIVSFGLTRRVDTEALTRDWATLPAAALPAFRWKAEVVTSELRKLDTAAIAAIAPYVTTQPASPTIKIEAL